MSRVVVACFLVSVGAFAQRSVEVRSNPAAQATPLNCARSSKTGLVYCATVPGDRCVEAPANGLVYCCAQPFVSPATKLVYCTGAPVAPALPTSQGPY